MSGSDRYLSMSLDDIIKIRKQRGTNRSSSVASSLRNRGAQNQRYQRGNRRNLRQGSQRGYGQLRGQSLRGRQQVNVSQRGYRGSQRRGLRSWRGQQFTSRQQDQASASSWPSYQSVASTQSQRRGRGVTRGGARPRGLPRLPVRAQGVQRPRGPQLLSATQLARNRVRLAAQILMQRRQQLQQIQMPRQALNSVAPQGQPRPLRGVASVRRRGRVYRGRLPASSFVVRGARRGAFINKMVARASLAQKMARARRNRELVARQLLSVSIDNEEAEVQAHVPVYSPSPAFSLPQVTVVNRQPPSLFRAPATMVRRRGRGGVPRAAPVVFENELELQEEEQEPIMVRATTPRQSLTLNERFSQC